MRWQLSLLFFKLDNCFTILCWFLLHYNMKVKVKVAQSCPPLCDPMDYTIYRNLQARILEWVAFPFSRGSSQPWDQPRSPTLQAGSLPAKPQGKPKNTGMGSLSLLQCVFPIQESKQGLLHCRRILHRLSYQSAINIHISFPFLLPPSHLSRLSQTTKLSSLLLYNCLLLAVQWTHCTYSPILGSC